MKKQYSTPKIDTCKPHTEPLLNAGSIVNGYNPGNMDLAPANNALFDDEDEKL